MAGFIFRNTNINTNSDSSELSEKSIQYGGAKVYKPNGGFPPIYVTKKSDISKTGDVSYANEIKETNSDESNNEFKNRTNTPSSMISITYLLNRIK